MNFRVRTAGQLCAALLVLTNIVLIIDQWLGEATVWPAWLSGGAAFVLAGPLPGALLVEWLLGPARSWHDRWEQSLYTLGVGYGCMVLPMLVLSYLPGGIAWWQTLLLFDLLVIVCLIGESWQSGRRHDGVQRGDYSATAARKVESYRSDSTPPRASVWFALIALLLVGGFFRLANLGYAEFQGDEATAVVRAVRLVLGDEDALLTHLKGPTEILIPAVIQSLSGRLTETTARIPFAVANLGGLLAVFLLGWQLMTAMAAWETLRAGQGHHASGVTYRGAAVAGWSGAMLLAVNGYFIGFGRIVQYQSIVFLTVTLVFLLLSQLAQNLSAPHLPGVGGRSLGRYLLLTALIMVVSLLSHYEAAQVAVPGFYLLARIGQSCGWRRLGRAMIAPILTGGVLLALFYVPFVRHPNFAITYGYITHNRLGDSFPYNNLAEFFARSVLYTTLYDMLLLVGLSVASLGLLYWRGAGRWRLWMVALLVVSIGLTFSSVTWATVGDTELLWLGWGVLLITGLLLPTTAPEERSLWLWFGIPMLVALFFVATPNTHVYGFFIAWAILAGTMIGRGWTWLQQRLGVRTARVIAIPLAVFLVGLLASYKYWYFIYHQVEVLRTWEENHPRGYGVTTEMPKLGSFFGLPLKTGWKVVGALYGGGVLDGAFDTNGKGPVAEWYTRGLGACPRDHTTFLFVDTVSLDNVDYLTEVHNQVARDYQLWGTVSLLDQPRLAIYRKSDRSLNPQLLPWIDYAAYFDNHLARQYHIHNGPIPQSHIAQLFAQDEIRNPKPVLSEVEVPKIQDLRFGDHIYLRGYILDKHNAAPGDTVRVTYYWESKAHLDQRYSVFNQVIDLGDFHKAGQRDGQPGCEQYPTTVWRPGQLIADTYHVSVQPDAPSRKYTLLMGLYDGENDRLPIFDADGVHLGDAVSLTTITVTP